MKLNDLIVAVFIALGVVSATGIQDMPFWVYLALGVIYVVFRIRGKGDNKFGDLSSHVGSHPKDPPGGGNG